jgi:hypothetical protein
MFGFSFPARVDALAARLVAAGVVLIAVTALATGQTALAAVLALGFAARVAWGPRFSVLARAALWLSARLGPSAQVAGAPKRFAQGIGAAVTLSATGLYLGGHDGAARLALVVLAAFAALEAGLGVCVGCHLHAGLLRAGLLREPSCDTCAIERA